MKSKCTLIIDGGWLLMSRFSVITNKFDKSLSKEEKSAASIELCETMARSISVILNRIPVIDNIILTAEGGSWRKDLQLPDEFSDHYKANRTHDNDIDWNSIYDGFNMLFNRCKEIGITVCRHNKIEGDDWVWYWTNRLNAEGTSCIIWSSDNDLKQLVRMDMNTGVFTAWYNDKNGLWLYGVDEKPIDTIDFFMRPAIMDLRIPTLEAVKTNARSINYIIPDDVIISKVICGDAGDNIKPVLRYEKNNRIYKITDKVWGEISKDIDIHDIRNLIKYSNEAAISISEFKKFKPYHIDPAKINDMILYNVKLVWLNESVIPDTVTQVMNQQEYLKFDVSMIKTNYKYLCPQSSEVEDLFNEIIDDLPEDDFPM